VRLEGGRDWPGTTVVAADGGSVSRPNDGRTWEPTILLVDTLLATEATGGAEPALGAGAGIIPVVRGIAAWLLVTVA